MRPVLVAPDLDKKFKVKTDVSNYTIKEVLSMKYLGDLQRPVAFILKSLSDTKRNYKIHNKEILAVVRCLKVQRYFLEETTTKFEIWTDYKNLEYFMKVKKLNRRQARWALYLLRFNFMLKYILESKIKKIDSLSKRLDWSIEKLQHPLLHLPYPVTNMSQLCHITIILSTIHIISCSTVYCSYYMLY